jgi:hypothetical protein
MAPGGPSTVTVLLAVEAVSSKLDCNNPRGSGLEGITVALLGIIREGKLPPC